MEPLTREPELTRDPEHLLDDLDDEERKRIKEEANLRRDPEVEAEDTENKHTPSPEDLEEIEEEGNG